MRKIPYFRRIFMKYFPLFLILVLSSCAKNSQVHPPVGGLLSQTDLVRSRNRAKILNETERAQIQDWIKSQNEKFYPMAMNYWSNQPELILQNKKPEGTSVSYSYELYDFDQTKIYPEPVIRKNVQIGNFQDLKAVENAVRYLKSGQEATLLVPSSLAFGNYGDNKKIGNDIPLIIKINVF